jgi:hypothetical protein
MARITVSGLEVRRQAFVDISSLKQLVLSGVSRYCLKLANGLAARVAL